MRTLSTLVAIAVAGLAFACDEGGSADPSARSSAEGPEATADEGGDELPAEFSPWTVESLRATDGLVEVGEPWKEARRRIDARMGMSIYAVRGEQWWAVHEGDSCWATALKVESGKVAEVEAATELTEEDGLPYRHCVAAAGRNKCFRDGGDPGTCNDEHPLAE